MKDRRFTCLFGVLGGALGVAAGIEGGLWTVFIGMLLIGVPGFAVGGYLDALRAGGAGIDDDSERTDAFDDPWDPDLTTPGTVNRFGGPMSMDFRAKHFFGRQDFSE